MMKDAHYEKYQKLSCTSNTAKSDIANKGLTAAGASLLASEIVLGGDGIENTDSEVVGVSGAASTRTGLAGVGDGSAQGFRKSQSTK